MQIFVRILGRVENGLMPLDVDASDSLDCVRDKLQWEKLVPLSHQKLIFDGTVLEGSRPISEYSLRHYSPTTVSDQTTWR